VLASGRPYALPAAHVLRVVRFRSDELMVVEGRELLKTVDGLVPLASLAVLLGLDEPARSEDIQTALIVQGDERSVALIVEELGVEREITARALPSRVAAVKQVSSATFVELGRIALVLNPQDLCRRALSGGAPRGVRTQASVQQPRVLVADDSATTRAVLKNVLEEAHYEVTTAHDGEQAFMLLQQRPFDILISDVQMPNRDGFALTEAVRGDTQLARLPVVLMTSLESEADRLRGMRAGASAYLTKGAFDHQTLLETMAALL
jgi:two-component system chemotaxis sensor kinase CheA